MVSTRKPIFFRPIIFVTAVFILFGSNIFAFDKHLRDQPTFDREKNEKTVICLRDQKVLLKRCVGLGYPDNASCDQSECGEVVKIKDVESYMRNINLYTGNYGKTIANYQIDVETLNKIIEEDPYNQEFKEWRDNLETKNEIYVSLRKTQNNPAIIETDPKYTLLHNAFSGGGAVEPPFGMGFKEIDGFEIGVTEVTQEQWIDVMNENPSKFKHCGQKYKGFDVCADHPVEQVSFNDIIDRFLPTLNDITGDKYVYNLPTRKQWDRAARAYSSTYAFGNDEGKLGDYAWYWDNAEGKTHEVGTKKATYYGLFDIHGNVWEWTLQSWFDYIPPQREVRGGGRLSQPRQCRSESAYDELLDYRYSDTGFRLVRNHN